MDNRLRVNVNQSLNNLVNVDSGLVLRDSLSPFHQVLQSVVAAVFQQDINILSILEGLDKLHNVLVLQGSMDFYFDKQLVALPFLIDGFFRDDFGRINFIVVLVNNLETLGKPTRAQ